MDYAAIIYNKFNIIVEVHETTNKKLAKRKGDFYTKYRKGYWYHLAEGKEYIEMYKAMINI